MSGILLVRWTIAPLSPPRALLGCAGCGTMRAFQPSGKARLNANGKRLTAWLIYKCIACEQTWNRPIFERQPRSAISDEMLSALQGNDPTLIDGLTFDIAALKRHSPRVETFEGFAVRPMALARPAHWDLAEIRIDNPTGHDVRLDRLLSGELALSRATIKTSFDRGLIAVDLPGKQVLRRPTRNATRVWLRPASEAERLRLAGIFSGYPPPDAAH